MAFAARLILFFVAVCCGSASAGPRDYYWYGTSWFPTAEAGCASVSPPIPHHVFSHVFIPPGYGGAYWQCFFADTTIPPPNTAKSGGGIKSTCPEGKVPDFDAHACVDAPPEPDPCPEAGTKEGDSSNAYTTNSRVPANNLCIGSCSWSAGGVVPSVCANGKCYYYGPFTSNGSACTGEGGAPPPPEPEPAPPDDASCVSKGQCPGTINGTKVCVPCSSKEGTTSESGSSSGTGTDSNGNPTGGTGTTETTKETTANCTNGSCNTTTTTTVTNPDGSTTTTTETESKPQVDFCKSNPGHIVCKGEDEGTWGGDCGSFQCTGDAVQCAQAQAAWKAACLLDVAADDPNVVKGGQAMSSDQSALRAQLGLDDNGEAFNLSSMIDSDPLFASGGGCPADQPVTLLGQSLTLSLSAWCSWLQTAGTILQAAAYLAAALIVFRRG